MVIHTQVSLNVEMRDVPLDNRGIFTQLLATIWLAGRWVPYFVPFGLYNFIEPIIVSTWN